MLIDLKNKIVHRESQDKISNEVDSCEDEVVIFKNIPGVQNGDPLRHMFDYAGIKYKLKDAPQESLAADNASKSIFARPYVHASGTEHKFSDFRAILRKYCI